MDLSLEEYITVKHVKKPIQKPSNKNKTQAFQGKGSIQSRLGKIKKPAYAAAKSAQNQFKVVTGGSKAQPFDARQKLQNKPKIADARDKLAQKTKFTDARLKIQSRQAKTGVVKLGQGNKFDARTKLKPKKTNQTVSSSASSMPRIMVGEFGRVATTSNTPVAATQGRLFKTVDNDLNKMFNEVAEDEEVIEDDLETFQHERGGAFNATITIKNPSAIQRIQPPTEPTFKPSPLRGPIIQIPNDRYAKPSPKPPVRPIMSQKARPSPGITTFTTDEQEDFMTEAFRTASSISQEISARAPSPILFQKKDTLPSEDIVSPLQGFRVLITNLHPVVTQDDIIELFGSVGALKKAKLIKQGLGEVIFVHKEDAVSSMKKYHNRELDGVPMQVKLVNASPGVSSSPRAAAPAPPKLRFNPSPVTVQSSPSVSAPDTPKDSSVDEDLLSTSASIPQPLRFGNNASKPDTGSLVDIGVIHKALFKTKADESPSRPVTFTVKI